MQKLLAKMSSHSNSHPSTHVDFPKSMEIFTLSEPLQTFTLFSRLTPELRLHIWHCALQFPRLVVIWKHEDRGSSHLRRSVSPCPLLSTCWESRRESLRYYASPITGPCILPPPTTHLNIPIPCCPTPQNRTPKARALLHDTEQPAMKPHYVGPGTDLIYLLGTDPINRRYKFVSWSCNFLFQEMDAPNPSFAPIKRLAVDELFLRSTEFMHFRRMPHSIWKLVLLELSPHLEELWVVVREGPGVWNKNEVEQNLILAKAVFASVGEGVCSDEDLEDESAEERALRKRKWKCPVVKMVTWPEMVSECWTSWED